MVIYENSCTLNALTRNGGSIIKTNNWLVDCVLWFYYCNNKMVLNRAVVTLTIYSTSHVSMLCMLILNLQRIKYVCLVTHAKSQY